MDKITPKGLWYLFGTLLLTAIYSVHLFRFTLFDNFTTLSNDAASYVLMARKWSLYFTPDQADLFTWPVVAYPPGLPWLLAISGASESVFLSHLVVSICLLTAIWFLSWVSYRKLGFFSGVVLTINFCMLPGALLQSMGILSENLYLLLSLASLVVFANIRKSNPASWMQYVLLFAFVCLAIMTRTVGVALLAAIGFIALFDKGMDASKRLKVTSVAVIAAVFLIAWKFLGPQQGGKTYIDNLIGISGNSSGGSSSIFTNIAMVTAANLERLPLAWNHYFSLTHDHLYFFVFSLVLLVLCVYTLLNRVIRLKTDAVYIFFYLLILLAWPYYIDSRFLHPIMFLMLLQPLLYIREKHSSTISQTLSAIMLAGLLVNSVIIQFELLKIKNWAESNEPQISHMYDLYNDLGKNTQAAESMLRIKGAPMARGTANTLKAMKESASNLTYDAKVATNKPAFYAMTSNRSAIHMISKIPLGMQFCRLKRLGASQVFIPSMTDDYNPFGLSLLEYYQPFLTNIQFIYNDQNLIEAVIGDLDFQSIEQWLEENNSSCIE